MIARGDLVGILVFCGSCLEAAQFHDVVLCRFPGYHIDGREISQDASEGECVVESRLTCQIYLNECGVGELERL